MEKVAVKVKKQAEKSIHQNHPWVYENSIIKQNKEGNTGDVAIIFDQKKNQFLALGLLDLDSPIRIKVLHHGSSVQFNPEFIRGKIILAFGKRKSLLETKTTAYRLLYGENDGLPGLVIDIYNEHAVVKLYSSIWFPYLNWIKEVLINDFKLTTGIIRVSRQVENDKYRKDLFDDGDIFFGKLQSEEVVFLEHGLEFRANLIKGHKTGYFLDHRHNRKLVRGMADGRSVLDIFSYAGGFSVNALAGGARSVISVDISGQALELAKENARLIGKEKKHKTIAGDAFEVMEELKSREKLFDLIIIDPPSFAKSKEQIKSALKSYRKLVQAAIHLMDVGGILVMASCSSRVSKEDFFNLVIEEFEASGRVFQEIQRTTHDVDHPEGIEELNYLKAVYVEVW